MEVKKTPFEGLVEIYPQIFKDNRGYFLETFHRDKFKASGLPEVFVQDNQSFSVKGVLRGLHFQNVPYGQGKLVKVLKGKVLDIAVDIRKNSPTYGKYYKYILDDEQGNMLYIPEGFAHGFLALEDAIFFYKCTNVYNKASEGGIKWNDPALGIDWEFEQRGIDPIVSEKDQQLPLFTAAEHNF